MNESVFRELLGESLQREYAEYEHVSEHRFSLSHRLAMKRIFAVYERNKRRSLPEQGRPVTKTALKHRIIIAGVILIITAFLAGWVWICANLYQIDHNTPKGYVVNEYAISSMKKQLSEEGIDIDSRVPTHRITDEQKDWLSSRYDLNFLSACSFTHEQFGNFMLDLAYLNVFSFDEVENFYVVLPFNSNHGGYLYKTANGNEPGGYVEPFTEDESLLNDDELQLELIKEYLKEKYAGSTENEYEQKAQELSAQRAECLSVLEDFFAQVSSSADQTSSDSKYIVEKISY